MVGTGIEVRHYAAWLHSIGNQALVDNSLGNTDIRSGARSIEVASANFPLERDVVGRIVMYLSHAVLHAGFHIDDCIENFVVDLNQRSSIRCGLRTGGRDRGNGIAYTSDLVDCQRWVRDFLGVWNHPATD